jgi:hypothetical protein
VRHGTAVADVNCSSFSLATRYRDVYTDRTA